MANGGREGTEEPFGFGNLRPIGRGTRAVERFSERVELGRASKPRKDPPTVEELLDGDGMHDATPVAPADGSDVILDQYYASDAEKATAGRLRERYGLRLRSIKRRLSPDGNHPKTPEAMGIEGRWTVEVKETKTYSAALGHLSRAMSQSSRVVVDASTGGMTMHTARLVLRDTLERYGEHYDELVVLLGDGQGLHWKRGD